MEAGSGTAEPATITSFPLPTTPMWPVYRQNFPRGHAA